MVLRAIADAADRDAAPTRAELAHAIGVAPPNIYRYLDGRQRLSTLQASLLMRELGLRVTAGGRKR